MEGEFFLWLGSKAFARLATAHELFYPITHGRHGARLKGMALMPCLRSCGGGRVLLAARGLLQPSLICMPISSESARRGTARYIAK